jgi:hypothetical protein
MGLLLLPTLHLETGNLDGSAPGASHESGFESRSIKGTARKKARTGEAT